ncbi:MAG: hypothetical protein ACYTAS_22515 [Planctomycetota bacterium]
MLLLLFAVVVGILCHSRESRRITRAQAWVLVLAGAVSCGLAAGLVLGGYV